MTVQSDVECGSTFTLWLPARRPEGAMAPEGLSAAGHEAPPGVPVLQLRHDSERT